MSRVNAEGVSLRVPPSFLDIDLSANVESRVRALVAKTPDLDPTVRAVLAASQEIVVDALREASVVYAAHSVHLPTPREIAIAQFYVAMHALPSGAPDALGMLARALEAPGRRVERVDLPCGPAVAMIEEPNGGAAVRPVHQVQVAVLSPERRRLAVLSLLTESRTSWPDYLDLMGMIVGSLRFDGPRAALTAPDEPPARSSIMAALLGPDTHGSEAR